MSKIDEGGKGEKVAPMFKVFDMNQRGEKARVHEVITKMYPKDKNGLQPEPETASYALFSDKACEMAMDHAMKFLRDAQFKVLRPNGSRIMPVPIEDHTKPIAILGEDEVVVRYNELSREALFRRVKVMAGSEDIDESTPIAAMAAFMTAWRKSLRGMTQGDAALAEKMIGGELGGGMSPAELNTMFPKSALAA